MRNEHARLFPRRIDARSSRRQQSGPPPPFFAVIAESVEGECQQIERDQQGRQVLLAVTEAVIKIIAVMLQHVERLVLDLPPGAAAGGQLGDRVADNRQIGDKAAVR